MTFALLCLVAKPSSRFNDEWWFIADALCKAVIVAWWYAWFIAWHMYKPRKAKQSLRSLLAEGVVSIKIVESTPDRYRIQLVKPAEITNVVLRGDARNANVITTTDTGEAYRIQTSFFDAASQEIINKDLGDGWKNVD
jgi:hypothetical protein